MGSDVGYTDTGGKQPRLGVQEHFLDVWPLEFPRTNTCLIRPQSLDSLITFVVVGPESSSREIASHLPPHNWGSEDSDDTRGEVD